MKYTIGTLVTDQAQYDEMRASFEAGGFGSEDCEYLIIDNRHGNTADAYDGLRQLLNLAKGTFVILCHQDVVLLEDGRAELDARLAELSERDPTWALAGNSGGIAMRKLALRISDKHRQNQSRGGPFPVPVMSLDENLIIVRRETRVSFSRDLHGFHMYGADICLNAAMLGYTSYVIDFHLLHKGEAATGKAFDQSVAEFERKWRRAMSPRIMQTTCTRVLLSNNPLSQFAFSILQSLDRARKQTKRLLKRSKKA